MTSQTDILFAPLLPVSLIIILGVLAVLVILIGTRRHPLGTVLRLLTAGGLVLFLLGPSRQITEGERLPDIVALLIDDSGSMGFDDRKTLSDDVSGTLLERLEETGVEVEQIRFGSVADSDPSRALDEILARIPRRRLSAAIVVTDGQIHGQIEKIPLTLGPGVPLHSLTIGDASEQTDRRIEIISAPRFGVVGEQVQLRLKVMSDGAQETGLVGSSLYVGGELYSRPSLAFGEEITITVPLRQPGETILELEVDAAPGELTAQNNRVAHSLTAVRDRLRVLLVSGEPHAGERVWRNTLKSDAAVDLVHFTILKPGNKTSVARRSELNLVEFPHQELFLEKLSSFDVVIFDRYTYRGVLQPFEFEEIARYVERGGAVLVAGGPEFSNRRGLAGQRNFAFILPILPNAESITGPFLPTLSDIGARHPVTASLEDPENWGRWLRYLPGQALRGDVVLQGPEGAPLLVLDRVGDGRIAVMMSDHVWLWAREFDGGGPHRELLKRLVHWLMQEPELEEEALRGTVDLKAGQLSLVRQSLSQSVAPITVTPPAGPAVELSAVPDPNNPGQFRANLASQLPGLYRFETRTDDGRVLYGLAIDESADFLEAGPAITSDVLVAPLSAKTSGAVVNVQRADQTPAVRRVREDGRTDISTRLALPRRDVSTAERIDIHPLLPLPLQLGILIFLALAAWITESRRLTKG